MAESGDGDRLGAIERQVRADVEALLSGHPMGEALAAMAFRLAGLLDQGVQPMAVAGISRELRETLTELAAEAVNDDDLDAALSRPTGAAEIRDPEKP